MGTPETLARRERRRRQAVRLFLLDQLFALDGVEYVAANAPESSKDAPGTLRDALPELEAAFGAILGLEVPRHTPCPCPKCRGTGRMAYRDASGEVDMDVCDCVLDGEGGER